MPSIRDMVMGVGVGQSVRQSMARRDLRGLNPLTYPMYEYLLTPHTNPSEDALHGTYGPQVDDRGVGIRWGTHNPTFLNLTTNQSGMLPSSTMAVPRHLAERFDAMPMHRIKNTTTLFGRSVPNIYYRPSTVARNAPASYDLESIMGLLNQKQRSPSVLRKMVMTAE